MQTLPSELLRSDSPEAFSIIPVENLDSEIPSFGKSGVVDQQMSQFYDDMDIKQLAKNIKERSVSGVGNKHSSAKIKKPAKNLKKVATKSKAKSGKLKKSVPVKRVHKRRAPSILITSESDTSDYSSDTGSSSSSESSDYYSSSSDSDSEVLKPLKMVKSHKRRKSRARQPVRATTTKKRTRSVKSNNNYH